MRFHHTRIAPRLLPSLVLAALAWCTFAQRNLSDVGPVPSETPATIEGTPAPARAAARKKAPDPPAAAHDQDAQISEYVREVFQDRDGHFWFGTNNDGVARHDGKTLAYFGVQDGFGGSAVRGIHQDDAGAVWFATEGGVSRYKDGAFTNYMLGVEPGDNDVWSMTLDRFGTVWLGTMNGVRRFDGTFFVPFHLPRVAVENPGSRFSPLVVFAITQDRAGNLWFGTDGEGVHKYDGRTFTSYTTAQGLGGNQVRSVYADRRGRVWVGTDGGGVTCFDGAEIRTFTANDGLNNDRVFGVLEDRAGNMWFSTLGAGACRYDGATFTAFREDRGLTRSHVQSMYEARDGTLWFGCSGGLFRLEGERFVNVTRNGPWQPKAQEPAAAAPAEVADPLASFARLIGGRWKMTARSGTSMYDTWHWGPGRRSIRAMTQGLDANGDPWRSITVCYWHPGRKEVRMLAVNPFARSVSEGAIAFDGRRASGAFDLHQSGRKREMGLRWTFEGDDKYRDELLEKGPNGYEVMNTWDRTRTTAAADDERKAVSPLDVPEKPSEFLRPVENLLWHVWEGASADQAATDDATTPTPVEAVRTRTTFEYVPEADAIYGRVETSARGGAPAHAMDLYVYHHTSARVLRCLALASIEMNGVVEAVVYEGDITPLGDGGAIGVNLKGYRADAVTSLEMRIDFEADATVRQRVWSIDGQCRTLTLDVRHTKRDPGIDPPRR